MEPVVTIYNEDQLHVACGEEIKTVTVHTRDEAYTFHIPEEPEEDPFPRLPEGKTLDDVIKDQWAN